MASRRLLECVSQGASYTRGPYSLILCSFNHNGLSETQSDDRSKGFNAVLGPQVTTFGWSRSHNDDNSDNHTRKPLKISEEKQSWSSLGFKSLALYGNVNCINYVKFSTGFATSGLPQGRESGRSSFFGGGPNWVRYASSGSGTVGESSDKIDSIPEYINDVAEVLGGEGVDVDIVNKAQAVSEVATAAADSAFPVAVLQYLIEAVHLHSGLPWWASIAATTLLIRSLTIPILISQLKATTRLTLMRPQLEEVTERMKQCTDPQMIMEGRQRVTALFKQYNISPFSPLKGLLIQGPIFLSFYLAITNMAANVPSFKEGGALWFLDLSTPDSLYLLPAITALSFWITVELNMQEGLEGNPMADKMKMFSRFFALITVPVTMGFPKAIFCYWITSNLFSLVYGAVVKREGVKRALGIPKINVPPKPAETFVRYTGSIEKGPPSSSLVHQRLRALERTVKSRRHGKKR